MVPRPEGRNAPDWAAKIHLSTAAVYYHNYLMGELLASQLRHCVEQDVLHGGAAGNVSRRFVTDRAVGEYLIQRVFRLGSSGHWHDTLARATGERLQPAYFVTQASAW
jgi:peptidyl-dipeptidase A